jgi:Flp pilus assembly protein TadG
MMAPFSRLLRRARRDASGSVLIEMAIVIPVMLTLLMGGVETGRYVYLHMKLQNAAAGIADVATRDEILTTAALEDVYWAAERFVAPFAFLENGVVIVSGVGVDAQGDPVVLWQEESEGPLTPSSQVGAPGETATMPEGLVLNDEDTAIVTEVFYQYQPWLTGVVGETLIQKTAFYRPRLGALDGLIDES